MINKKDINKTQAPKNTQISESENQKNSDPRKMALNALSLVLNSQRGIQEVLDELFSNSEISQKDKALCTELSYGSLRYLHKLHLFLDNFLKQRETLPQDLPLLFSIAMYELFHTRIPAYATINSYVNLVRSIFSPALSGLANGVLRNADRQREKYLDEEIFKNDYNEEMDFLAFKYSMPQSIIELWQKSYEKEEIIKFLGSFLEAPLNSFRLNIKKEGIEDLKNKLLEEDNFFEDQTCPNSLIFKNRPPDNIQKYIDEGYLSQQSPAVQLLLNQLDIANWPDPIWDACCGRGGKCLLLHENGKKITLASDTSKIRLQGLQSEMKRLGFEGAFPVKEMSADQPFFGKEQLFGTIILDLPCSGFGTMSRNPEIRYRRTQDELADFVKIQKDILYAVKDHLEYKGRLIYISCTINPDENEGQIASFMENNTDFKLIKEIKPDPQSRFREYFYAAVLEKSKS